MQIGFVFILFFWGEQCVGMFNVATTCRDKCRTIQETKENGKQRCSGEEKKALCNHFSSLILVTFDVQCMHKRKCVFVRAENERGPASYAAFALTHSKQEIISQK